MSNLLYANSTGELRIQLFDEAGSQVTTGTVTATFALNDTAIFTARAMAYSASRYVTPDAEIGCWWCVVAATEVTEVTGTYTATITAIDLSLNQLTVETPVPVVTNTG